MILSSSHPKGRHSLALQRATLRRSMETRGLKLAKVCHDGIALIAGCIKILVLGLENLKMAGREDS